MLSRVDSGLSLGQPATMRRTLSLRLFILLSCGGNLLSCGSNATPNDASTDNTAMDTGTLDTAVQDTSPPVEAAAPVPCGTTSAAALASCGEQSRYAQTLTQLAHVRPAGSAGWQQAQTQIAAELTAAGFDPALESYESGVNIVARRAGNTITEEWIVLSAHYDSVANCAGADDNGSGVAGVLEAARVLGRSRFSRGIILALWDQEEDGLLGSTAFAEGWAARALGQIRFAVSLEMIGYRSNAANSQSLPPGFDLLFANASAFVRADASRGNFIAIVHDAPNPQFADSFVASANSFGLRATTVSVPMDLLQSSLLSDLQRSDHAAFWNENIPAAMVTDTANFRNRHYHCGSGADAIDTIDMEFAANATRATVEAVATALGVVAR